MGTIFESEIIEGILDKGGHEKKIVVNTCAVTNSAVHKSIQEVKELLLNVEGVSSVLTASESSCLGHERSGDLLVLAQDDTWFAYPYWLDEKNAPDFSKCVDIFNKPGFDPCEPDRALGRGGGTAVGSCCAGSSGFVDV